MSRLQQNFADVYSTVSDLLSAVGGTGNGRVDLLSPLPSFNIPAYNKTNINNTNFPQEATYGQLASTPVSKLFFSAENIDALQEGIRYRVYTESQGRFVIGRQSDQELRIVMRSVYYQYARNDGSDCVAQTRELNTIVLQWAVADVLSNLLQYQTYKKDASTLPMPLEYGPLMSTKGTKDLEWKAFV